MRRLPSELFRLHGLEPARASASSPALLDADGRTRTLVIELARPAEWEALGRVWAGLQDDLGWPAPAIAINGRDGLQLWVSLAHPTRADRVQPLLNALVARYLPDVPAQRVSLWPRRSASAKADTGWCHVGSVPAEHPGGQWSAFVSPGLAPVFADTPWLDIPPGEDGQADVLSGLRSVTASQWDHAVALLAPAPQSDALTGMAIAPSVPASSGEGGSIRSAPLTDPRQFLLQVMNDERVDMALRIEAAKALLPTTLRGEAGIP